MKSLFVGLISFLLLVSLAIGVYYYIDSGKRVDALRSGGTSITTSAGVTEYQLVGNGDGDVLLFFHGTPGGYDQGIAATTTNRVLTISRPGYLGTPLSTGETPAQQAAAARALLDALDIQQVAVMGVSGGGPAAYTFAATYPGRTVGLVAMEAISHAIPQNAELGLPGSDLIFWLMLQSLHLTQDNSGVVKQMAQNTSDRERLKQQPQLEAQVAEMIWSMWPPSMRKTGFDNDFAQFESIELPLESIQVPTLIVHGTLDQAVPFEHAEYAASRIPGAKLHAIKDAGHMMPFAHESEVTAVVNEFFESR